MVACYQLNITKKRKDSDRINQAALLVWDVQGGQKTKLVLEVLRKSNFVTVHIPNNMANYYQPLDCSPNKWGKEFMKNKLSCWYTEEVQRELKNGTLIENIGIKFQLTTMKPLLAKWITQLCNELT